MKLFQRSHQYEGRHRVGRQRSTCDYCVPAAPVAAFVARSPLVVKPAALRVPTIGERAALRRRGYRMAPFALVAA